MQPKRLRPAACIAVCLPYPSPLATSSTSRGAFSSKRSKVATTTNISNRQKAYNSLIPFQHMVPANFVWRGTGNSMDFCNMRLNWASIIIHLKSSWRTNVALRWFSQTTLATCRPKIMMVMMWLPRKLLCFLANQACCSYLGLYKKIHDRKACIRGTCKSSDWSPQLELGVIKNDLFVSQYTW